MYQIFEQKHNAGPDGPRDNKMNRGARYEPKWLSLSQA